MQASAAQVPLTLHLGVLYAYETESLHLMQIDRIMVRRQEDRSDAGTGLRAVLAATLKG